MIRMRALTLSLLAAIALLALLLSAVDVFAQTGVPPGNWNMDEGLSGWTCNSGPCDVMDASHPSNIPHPPAIYEQGGSPDALTQIFSVPDTWIGHSIRIYLEWYGSSGSTRRRAGIRAVGGDNICSVSELVGNGSWSSTEFNCVFTSSGPWEFFASGDANTFGLDEISFDASAVPGLQIENDFGLTCTYTNTHGITQTVSANRVLNPSFEVFNYGSLPAGWSVSSPGSTFYAATDNSYDGDTSLQYQPNSGRLFAQACRSVGIEADTQSIAAGVHFAGGGSGTSDVTLLLDGEVLGTTTVTGSDGWTSLTVTSTNDSENLFQQFCIEVQGANRAYIDAAWLYASDSNDLSGLLCPAPVDDVVPPPPPRPPVNDDDGIPTPQPDDLGTCYRCIRPFSILEIGSWIKWLLCGLQNLFRCELFLWLLRIQNLISGLFGQFIALVLWLPDGFQIGLNWFGSAINGSITWLLDIWNNFRSGFTQFLFGLVRRVLETDFVQALWTASSWIRAVWEYAWSLIQAVLATIGSVFNAAIQVIEMIGNIISSVAEAWTAPGYRIDFIPGAGGPGGGEFMTAIEADGINDAKVYWILVSGLAALDAIAGDFGFQYLQYLLIGALAFGVIAWSLKQFQDFLPA